LHDNLEYFSLQSSHIQFIITLLSIFLSFFTGLFLNERFQRL